MEHGTDISVLQRQDAANSKCITKAAKGKVILLKMNLKTDQVCTYTIVHTILEHTVIF